MVDVISSSNEVYWNIMKKIRYSEVKEKKKT